MLNSCCPGREKKENLVGQRLLCARSKRCLKKVGTQRVQSHILLLFLILLIIYTATSLLKTLKGIFFFCQTGAFEICVFCD